MQPIVWDSPQLPICPSVNHLYERNWNGTLRKSEEYLQWISDCQSLIKEAGALPKESMKTKLGVYIDIHGGKGWRKGRDLGNCDKAILDMLRSVGIIEDDSTEYVIDERIRYVKPYKKTWPAFIEIEVREVESL